MKKRVLLILFLVGISCQVFAQTPATPRGLEGSWQGTLEIGASKLRLVLKISKSTDGGYSGVIDSVDQGSTIPIDVITVSGDSVRLELKSVGATFEGALNKDRSELAGKFSQGDADGIPLSFKPADKATASAPASPPAAAQRPFDVPVDVTVPVPPTAVKSAGRFHLVYEIHITNFSRDNCALARAEVVSGDGGAAILARYEGTDLAGRLLRPGVPGATGADKLKIGPGLRAVIYVWVSVDSLAAVPRSLLHRLFFKVGDYPDEMSVECARVAVGRAPVVISPPLKGSEWLAGNGPSDASGHRRALVPVGGGVYIAQRFAIDFVQLRETGRSFLGDPKDNKNYRCYGSEALAVADAVVVAVKDGIPENIPGVNSRAVPITLETVGGNHVVLDIGNGRYAFYAHLQPGKIRVKSGDKVRRGQVLGLVGNSGNSTEPHLHFHISDANSPLGSNGLPYVFPSFEVQGKGWGWKPGSEPKTEKREMEIPFESEVVRFP